MITSYAPRFFCCPGNTPNGRKPTLPEKWGAARGLSGSGASVGGRTPSLRMLLDPACRAFFPSAQRAQITALACTLPKDSGKPLSRWSSPDLAELAIEKKIVSSISASTIRQWLREEKIKPWQHRSWQKPTDPLFLEKATVVLNLYEQAQELARRCEIIVCADEKTCIQALRVTGGVVAAGPGKTLRRGCRYKRLGIANLFAGLLVHTGETIARFFERKRFVDFQEFLSMILSSLWTRNIRVLHFILDNGPTHAPKQIESWIESLRLPFAVQIHWLPKNSSWLDQVEIVFSPLQRKVLTPRHFDSIEEMKTRILGHLAERNKSPRPIRWSYTSAKLREKFARHSMELVHS